MELLRYETQNVPDASYPGLIKTFIKTVRYYKTERSNEDFKAAMPELLAMEQELKKVAKDNGEPRREYLEEVMDALASEQDIKEKLGRELKQSAGAIMSALYNGCFHLNDFLFDLRTAKGINWIEFYGYKDGSAEDSVLLLVKEAFRAACYKMNMLFIDMSLTG